MKEDPLGLVKELDFFRNVILHEGTLLHLLKLGFRHRHALTTPGLNRKKKKKKKRQTVVRGVLSGVNSRFVSRVDVDREDETIKHTAIRG